MKALWSWADKRPTARKARTRLGPKRWNRIEFWDDKTNVRHFGGSPPENIGGQPVAQLYFGVPKGLTDYIEIKLTRVNADGSTDSTAFATYKVPASKRTMRICHTTPMWLQADQKLVVEEYHNAGVIVLGNRVYKAYG